ncbi:MAG: SH3 domain-containing protein [Leptolyngbyaceae cyanobacterium CSU_1_4]|nr:SH3 domain-containing protein [Leptolyngbyaceae cyanobacterium CSU_1_4]
MISGNSGTSLKQATTLNVNAQNTAYQNAIGDVDAGKYYRFQLNQKSSLESNSQGTKASTKNQSTIAPKTQVETFNSWNATANSALSTQDLYVRSAKAKAKAASNNPNQWNASFLNRSSSNVADYNSYDFSRPAATLDLGSGGGKGKTAAQLKISFGNGRPTSNVQSNNFALQAWTRVKLQEGKFYKVSSDSDDGTRFFFKDQQTGQVLTTLNGDWRTRTTRDPEWSKVLSVPKGGKYDFYVQYYDKSGRSSINVKLEEVEQTGRVKTSTGLNVRQQPSTTGNTPFRLLKQNDTFKIRKQVKSNDASNPDWYEIQTKDGKRGFVSAGSGLSEVVGGSNVVTLGTSEGSGGITTKPPIAPTTPTIPTNPNTTGGFGSGSGSSIPAKGLVKGSSIGLRSAAGTSASILGDLSKNTALNIVGKVAGDKYYVNDVPYDQWYQVKTGNGQTGYVAAYYVDGGDNGGKYSSSLNSKSTYYGEHFRAAQPYKAAVTAAAAPYSKWLKPSILAAIGSRESGWGLFLDSNDSGDGGHGRGIMQIDDRYHQDFINSKNWRDPGVNIQYAVDNVLAEYYSYLSRNTSLTGFDLLRGAIASYNAGPGNVVDAVNAGLDVDAYTTGKDYSWDVIQRAGWFQDNGWA